jgi:hypothetical protein
LRQVACHLSVRDAEVKVAVTVLRSPPPGCRRRRLHAAVGGDARPRDRPPRSRPRSSRLCSIGHAAEQARARRRAGRQPRWPPSHGPRRRREERAAIASTSSCRLTSSSHGLVRAPCGVVRGAVVGDASRGGIEGVSRG